jgi:hypothetical protein
VQEPLAEEQVGEVETDADVLGLEGDRLLVPLNGFIDGASGTIEDPNA